jgi:hypothetical protein
MGVGLGSSPVAMDLLTAPQLDDAPVVGIPLDALVRLQLRVARRADELTRLREHDLGYGYWETAERELLPESLRLSA